jgi:hypothetical protein
MKTAMRSNSLIVLLLLIAANCIARSVKNELNSKERFNPLIQRNQTNNVSCKPAISFFQIRSTIIEGGIYYIESSTNDCDPWFLFYMNMNALYINHTVHFYQYNGTIVTACWPFDENTYSITGHVYFSDGRFNGSASMCSDECANMSFSGEYEYEHNDSYYDVAVEAKVCQ